ncbi:hypothetical protein [Streptomyces sp. STR69]|uniref:hypothetical protein n=1 Tax=Streptomyces sp. STR69 TaxID=1796942 RepID=UPI0021C7F0B9|nr:hypothetical protein [Streptomyces sp. STR69]
MRAAAGPGVGRADRTTAQGRPAAADARDVLYSLKWMAKPGNGLALDIADVDLEKVSAPEPYTVVVPWKGPDLLPARATPST